MGLAALAVTSSSCFTQGETTCGQEDSARAPIKGRVVSAKTGEPLAGSMVIIELCGLYSENPDPSKGHPNYRYGGLAAADGSFSIDIPKGSAGIHTFLEGYRYGFMPIKDTTAPDLTIANAEPLLAEDKKPVLSGFKVVPLVASPDAELTFSVNARASSNKDPLSEELVVLEPKAQIARALAPPRRGVQGVGYPDGTWTGKLNAPKEPGQYTYYVGVTSEQCVVGNTLTVMVTVQ